MDRLYWHRVPVLVLVLTLLPLATVSLVVTRTPAWHFFRDSPSGRIFFDSARHFPLSRVFPNETKFNPTNANVYQGFSSSWIAPPVVQSATTERTQQEEQVEPSTNQNQTGPGVYVPVPIKDESDRRSEGVSAKPEVSLQGNNYQGHRSYSGNPLVDEAQFFRDQPLIDVRSGHSRARGENRRAAPRLTTTLRPPSTFDFDQEFGDGAFDDLFRLDDFRDIFNSQLF